MMQLFTTHSAEETRRIAKDFAQSLKRGDVIALYGDLGTGKTQFVKGLCEAFGVEDTVTSPTFVLCNCYRGYTPDKKKLSLYHFDLYRLQSVTELYDIGYEEYFNGDGICCIEWAERAKEILPRKHYSVSLTYGKNENDRTIEIWLQEN